MCGPAQSGSCVAGLTALTATAVPHLLQVADDLYYTSVPWNLTIRTMVREPEAGRTASYCLPSRQ